MLSCGLKIRPALGENSSSFLDSEEPALMSLTVISNESRRPPRRILKLSEKSI